MERKRLSHPISIVIHMTLAEILDADETAARPLGADLEVAMGLFAKELDDLDVSQLGDAVRRTAELRSKLDAVEIGLVDRIDRSGEFLVDGYRHPTAWIKEECRLRHVRRVLQGRRLFRTTGRPGS